MFEVVSLKTAKDGKSCILQLNTNEFFNLSIDVIAKFKLFRGKKLTQAELDALIKEQKIIEAKNSALNYVSYKPRTMYQIQQKLQKAKYDQEVIDATLKFLEDFGYLDDYKFAKEFVEHSIKTKKSSILKIKNDLVAKGIKREIIDDVLLELQNSEAEIENALSLAKKRLKIMSQGKKKKNQLEYIGQYLFRKGFDWNTINRVLEAIKKEIENNRGHFKQ